jgi:hypothetical protein
MTLSGGPLSLDVARVDGSLRFAVGGTVKLADGRRGTIARIGGKRLRPWGVTSGALTIEQDGGDTFVTRPSEVVEFDPPAGPTN